MIYPGQAISEVTNDKDNNIFPEDMSSYPGFPSGLSPPVARDVDKTATFLDARSNFEPHCDFKRELNQT